jgi:NAD(P)-dependent dehydrogenase (short-subunit alcohol dehydrogenase family)
MVIQPRRVIHEAVDVVQEASVSGFLTRTKLQFGKLDSIANFAGTGGHVLEEQIIWDTDQAEYNFIMDLNVRALYYILRASLQPGFLNEPGSIVHITSMYVERGF